MGRRWRRDSPVVGNVRSRRGFRSAHLDAIGALSILLLLVVVALSLQIRDHPQISPIDELVHGDYMVKVANGHLPRAGSLVGAQMLREDACRGADLPGFPTPPCSAAVLRPEKFQGWGYNSALRPHPPTYYLVTGLGARLLVTLTPVHSIVSAARALGILWLACGVVILWLALAELNISPGARLIATAPVIVTPVILDAHAYINNDATAFVTGAALLLVTLRWEMARAPAWLVLVVAAFAGGTKITNLLGVSAMAIYLVARALNRNRASLTSAERPVRRCRQAVALGFSMVAVSVVVNVLWLIVAAARAIQGPPNPLETMFYAEHVGLGQFVGQFGAGVSPVGYPLILSPLAGHQVFVALVFALNLLVIGGCVAAVAAAPAGSRRENLGLSAAVVMAATGPFFSVLAYLTTHNFFAIPSRYGLVLIPMLIATLAALLDKRLLRFLVGGFSAMSVGLTLARLVAG